MNFSSFFVEALGLTSLAMISYLSTNFDNLVILSAYMARPGYRAILLMFTFMLVCVAVLGVSLLLAKAADNSLLADRVRYLGLIPIAIGGYQLLRLILGRASGVDPVLVEGPARLGLAAYFGFGLILLANSSDSISILTPLLADVKPALTLVIFAAALLTALLMTGLANLLAGHPTVSALLDRVARWALPFLLIAIGLLILLDRPADVFRA